VGDLLVLVGVKTPTVSVRFTGKCPVTTIYAHNNTKIKTLLLFYDILHTGHDEESDFRRFMLNGR